MVVRAEILIAPGGEPRVQVQPGDASTEDVLQLALCYGAELRRSLSDGPAWLLEAFEEFTREAAEFWAAHDARPLLERLPSIPAVRLKMVGAETAAPRHERWVVQLFRDENGTGYPCGCAPPNPLRANRVWHFMALLQALAERSDGAAAAETIQPALRSWWSLMFPQRVQQGEEVPSERWVEEASRIFRIARASWHDRAEPEERLAAV